MSNLGQVLASNSSVPLHIRQILSSWLSLALPSRTLERRRQSTSQWPLFVQHKRPRTTRHTDLPARSVHLGCRIVRRITRCVNRNLNSGAQAGGNIELINKHEESIGLVQANASNQ